MKNRTVVLSIAIVCWLLSPFGGVGGGLFAQGVGINPTGAAPAASTMLDISSNNKGLLIPRLALTASNIAAPVTAPATSLLIYNTATAGTIPNDVTPGFYYWDGSQWVKIVSGNIVGTDDQNLTGATLTGNTLQIDIENGASTTVDLTPVLATAGTDDQNLTSATLAGTILTITIENGTAVNIDLASLVNDLDSDPTNEYNTGANLTGTDLNIIDGGSTLTVDLTPLLDSAKIKEEWVDGSLVGLTPGDIYARQALANNGDTVVVTNNGRIGIGTNTPLFGLTVNGTGNNGLIQVIRSGKSITINPNHSATNTHALISTQLATNMQLRLGTNEGNHLTIDLNGNVGIGTVNPNFGKLQVNQSTDNSNSGVAIINSAGTTGLRLWTDNLNKGRIDANAAGSADLILNVGGGNVGIGTTTPANKLEITQGTAGNSGVRMTNFPNIGALATDANGDVIAASAAPTNGAFWGLTGNLGTTPVTNFLGTTNAQDLVFRTNNTEKMRVLSNGNVGIGTATPSRTLDVYGDVEIGNSGLQYFKSTGGINNIILNRGNGNASALTGSDILFNGRGLISSEKQMFFTIDSDNNDSDTTFFDFGKNAENDISSTSLMRIQENGNVGIGTTTPTSQLHVDNSTFWTTASKPALGIQSLQPTIAFYDDNEPTGNVFSFSMHDNGINLAYTNYIANDWGFDERINIMHWEEGGNVGIGTILPTRLLHIKSAVTGNLVRLEDDDKTWHHGISGANGWGIWENGVTSPDNRFIISVGGDIGIGTALPTEKLHVVGNILASGTITPSDKRYKKEINTLTGALKNVMELRGVNYQMKKEYKEKGFGNGIQIGVIAQEVEKIYPELIVTHSDGFKGVDYSKFTPILIEAIKEQQQLIKALQQDNKLLKAANDEKASQSKMNTLKMQQLENEINEIKIMLGQKAEK